MRQQTLINFKYETAKQRMQRMKRNRQIRKQRIYGKYNVEEAMNAIPIFGDEKNHIQKLKNRQAAQKSRQQKKLYINQLQQEIKYLRTKLSTLKNCQNCQKLLQISQSQIENSHQQSTARGQTSPEVQQKDNGFEYQIQNEDLQSEFIRVSSTDQNSSIGIYLFIFMIILGVFCIGSRMDSSDSFNPLKRDLTQLYSNNAYQSDMNIASTLPIQYDLNLKSTYSTQSGIDSKKYENGLLSMSQVKSPSLISDEKYFEKIITSFENYKISKYDDKNLRSKGGLVDANKSIMFCNRPKIYKSNQNKEGILTTFIDIFVKGAQIINFFPEVNPNSINSQNLQLNGLYKITASVEEIEEINNSNLVY